MEYNTTKPSRETQEPETSGLISQPKLKKNNRPLMIVMLVALWIGTLAIVFWISGNVNEKTSTQVSIPDASAGIENNATLQASSNKVKFDYRDNGIPFTFDYPVDWVLTTESAWLYQGNESQGDPSNYSFRLLAPGTLESETGMGGLLILKGSKIEVRVSKSSSTIDEYVANYTNIAGTYNVKKVMIGDIDSVQYFMIGEGGVSRGIYTVIIKSGVQYTFRYTGYTAYDASSSTPLGRLYESEKTSKDYKIYDELLKSIKI